MQCPSTLCALKHASLSYPSQLGHHHNSSLNSLNLVKRHSKSFPPTLQILCLFFNIMQLCSQIPNLKPIVFLSCSPWLPPSQTHWVESAGYVCFPPWSSLASQTLLCFNSKIGERTLGPYITSWRLGHQPGDSFLELREWVKQRKNSRCWLLGNQPGDLKLEKLPRRCEGDCPPDLSPPHSPGSSSSVYWEHVCEKSRAWLDQRVVYEGIWTLSVLTFLPWYVGLFLHIWIGSNEIIYAKALWNISRAFRSIACCYYYHYKGKAVLFNVTKMFD